MFSRILRSAAVALAATQLVSAQTFTDCNPMEKTCPDDPALGKTVTVDFTKGENDVFKNAEGTTIDYDDELGAVFTINKETEAPTIASNKFIFFGKIDVVVRACTGQGVVTSFVLQSDDLDEIDWEWLGGDTTQVQTNYFGKGDTTTYDRGAYHTVATPQDTFHKYSIDWTSEYVKWYIDDELVRTLNYEDATSGTRFPQTPMQIKLGTWVAGREDAAKGTVEWAGGYTDFSTAPFNAYYQSITIEDYSNGVDDATSYHWSDKTGSFDSIEVLTGGEDTSATSKSSSTKTVTSKGSESTNTTLATKTGASGITQATEAANVSASGSDSSATATGSSSASTSATTSAPVTAGAFKSSFNVVVLGVSLLIGGVLAL
ncbi:family 16 glycosyl hydrolase [Pseudomassariella vexata]|uniref:Crh-like protein n=1 Tax=Pseudomassariella vexata TaxID=1141098 RepID=A0A1Y2DVE9_9PEZI|nr:family 16 glycosyl hydrolase [Pseudomassariella vexata]ORY62625.1 family 16 glycosyl hydrolase [Pseudomassariella vexata]